MAHRRRRPRVLAGETGADMATVYKRGRTWWIRVQHHGTEIRRSAKTSSKREAREYLGRVLMELRAADLGERPPRTFEDAAVRFFERHAPGLKPQTVASYQYITRTLAKEFGGLDLSQITRRRILDFEAGAGVGKARLARYRAVLSGIFKAAQAEDWIENNPVRGLPALRVRDQRFRFLSRAEWADLHPRLSPGVRGPAALAVATGMRAGEILALRWRDVDFDRDEIVIRDGKSGGRVIPLEGALPAQNRAQAEAFVFAVPRSRNDLSRRFSRDAERAGHAGLRFHDLRHTFASWWVQEGGDVYVLQRRLGHRAPAMTQRYAHLRTEDLRR